jgi:hypothetical protein
MDDQQHYPSNIPIPDPSIATAAGLRALRDEVRGWVDSLQILHEVKIERAEDRTSSLDRVVQTRLAGSETALNAAMAAADKVTQKIEINFTAVMTETKAGMTKQIDTIKESIDDLKGRLDRGEGISRGNIDSSTNQRDSQRNIMAAQAIQHSGWQAVAATGALIAAVLSIIISIVVALTNHAPAAPVYHPAANYTHSGEKI